MGLAVRTITLPACQTALLLMQNLLGSAFPLLVHLSSLLPCQERHDLAVRPPPGDLYPGFFAGSSTHAVRSRRVACAGQSWSGALPTRRPTRDDRLWKQRVGGSLTVRVFTAAGPNTIFYNNSSDVQSTLALCYYSSVRSSPGTTPAPTRIEWFPIIKHLFGNRQSENSMIILTTKLERC